MSKHTPGPWIFNKTGCIESADGSVIAVSVTRITKANGLLLAAAPELLDALIVLTRIGIEAGVTRDAIRMARDAIAKAEGAS